MKARSIARLALVAALLPACGKSSAPNGPTRSYYMGLTPFPYALSSAAALEYTFAHIASDADMMAVHLGGYGVPWPEASADAFPYNAALMGAWASIRSNTKSGQRVYLALSPINTPRNGIAELWDATGTNRPLPPPWNAISFNDPRVQVAFLNYCRRAITYFNPDYLTIGIEVNQLMAVNPAAWPAYLGLHQNVYRSLKALYPSLPIMVSMTANELLGYVDANAANQDRARAEIADTTDYFCLSTYLYIGANAGGSFPADVFDRLRAMTNKPMAICETGYPSQSFTLRRTGATTRSDPNAQKAFIDRLFQAADRDSYRFIVHFFVRDLDESLDVADAARLFRYDGLYDSNGNAKPAQASWQQKLAAAVHTAAVPVMSRASDEAVGGAAVHAEDRESPALSSSAAKMEFVYTNDNANGPNSVSAFALGVDGALTPIAGAPFLTGGSGTGIWDGALNDIVATPQGFLYAANPGSGDISGFAIDATDGRIKLLAAAPWRSAAWSRGDAALAVTATGDVLVGANPDSKTLAVFDIGSDGSLTERTVGPAGGRPRMLTISPDGRFVLATLEGDGRVAVFAIERDSVVPVKDAPFAGRFGNATTLGFGCGDGALYAANAPIGGRPLGLETLRLTASGSLDAGNRSWEDGSVEYDAGGVVLVGGDGTHLFMTGAATRDQRDADILVFQISPRGLAVVDRSRALRSGDTVTGMSLSRAGEFLVTANHPSSRDATASAGVFAVSAGGSLTAVPGSPFAVPGSTLASVAAFPPVKCPASQ